MHIFIDMLARMDLRDQGKSSVIMGAGLAAERTMRGLHRGDGGASKQFYRGRNHDREKSRCENIVVCCRSFAGRFAPADVLAEGSEGVHAAGMIEIFSV
jgi:hypothetical protein